MSADDKTNHDNHTEQNVTWSEKGHPISRHYCDMYFSIADGLEESRYVFIEQNRLTERFQQLESGEHFIIGETGFGTGRNFLCTWEHWLNHAPKDAHCHFISTEKYPLSFQELQQSLKLWPALHHITTPFLEAYQKQFIGTNEPHYYRFNFDNITLTLIVEDVCLGLKQLLPGQHEHFKQPQWQGVDAWYLDGFSPAKNPDMWSEELIQLIHLLSKNNATLTTYAAASSVKKTLEANGFLVQKAPGFGKKRELITASLNNKHQSNTLQRNKKNQTPWAFYTQPNGTNATQNKSIAIIGAGLAGCHTAYALAQKGFNVTIFEGNEIIASEASGNAQAMLYAKLSANKEPLAEFNLACLLKAQAFYSPFWDECNKNVEGQQCGLLQLAQNEKTRQKQERLYQRFQHAQFLEKSSVPSGQRLANITLDKDGIYLPYCGWVDPKALCQWLLESQYITLATKTKVRSIEANKKQQWALSIQQDNGKASQQIFDNAVICNAYAATQFTPTEWLPIKALRGQISYIETEAPISDLMTIITGENYIAPVRKDEKHNFHTIGASYDLKNTHKKLTEVEHQQNLSQLNELLPAVKANTPTIVGGRANLRCTSPDYLPLIGQVPNKAPFIENYKALAYNAKQVIDEPGEYLPGLYLNTGHGSRGLAYTPMAAEIIACQLSQTPPPIAQDLIDLLNPARFLIRSLKTSFINKHK